MSIGDLVVDSVGRCGLVVCESEMVIDELYLVLFSDRKVWCSKWEFRVLEDCSSTHRCGEG